MEWTFLNHTLVLTANIKLNVVSCSFFTLADLQQPNLLMVSSETLFKAIDSAVPIRKKCDEKPVESLFRNLTFF